MTRDGSNVCRCFVDGTLQAASNTLSDSDAFDRNFDIGRGSTANDNCSWYGHLDEVRITDSVCRYTANFTAPTARFPAS